MDVYLDDIVIYSNTIEEHVQHSRLIMNTLHRERLYLSRKKLHLFATELKILGRIVNDEGVCMDPSKVDKVINWKVMFTSGISRISQIPCR